VDPFKPQRNARGSFSASEWRRRKAEALYAVETELRNNGVADERLTCDEKHGVFRFAYDGVFAFSREHANWAELRRRGMLER
jgi:hypothetical protein